MCGATGYAGPRNRVRAAVWVDFLARPAVFGYGIAMRVYCACDRRLAASLYTARISPRCLSPDARHADSAPDVRPWITVRRGRQRGARCVDRTVRGRGAALAGCNADQL